MTSPEKQGKSQKDPWNPSRRAIERVKNRLPAPTECPYCAGAVKIVSNAEIYSGKTYGEWPWAYLCKGCGAYVGMHPYTDIPLGSLADADLRKARKLAKQPFETWRRTRGIERGEAYALLAKGMGIPVGECHFGWFDKERCEKAEAVASALLKAG